VVARIREGVVRRGAAGAAPGLAPGERPSSPGSESICGVLRERFPKKWGREYPSWRRRRDSGSPNRSSPLVSLANYVAGWNRCREFWRESFDPSGSVGTPFTGA
jgi:hypothetical protein